MMRKTSSNWSCREAVGPRSRWEKIAGAKAKRK